MGELAIWQDGKLVGGTIARLAPRLANIDRDDEIGSSTALIGPDACAAIIAEADTALEPCGKDFALRQASIMLAVFAGARAEAREEKPETRAARDLYVRAVTGALAKAPAHVVEQVVADVVMTHRYGNPLPADITARIEAIVQPIRDARYVAWRHQREHAKRAEARRKQEAEDARIAANPLRDRSELDAVLARLAAHARPDMRPERPQTEAQRVAATLSAVDLPAYWQLVGDGVGPEEAAARAHATRPEAAE